MKPIDQLKSIIGKKYESEDGDEYSVELLPGLSEEEISELKKQLPCNTLPAEIEELLRFSRGFEFLGLDEIRFDGVGQFGFEEVFPNSVQLAGDGFGNFWVLDIDNSGKWGSVYYVCHDPAVLVKHSDDLSEFIKHVDEFGMKGRDSNLDIIHEKIVFDIWQTKNGIMEQYNKTPDFPPEFMRQLPEVVMIADLTNARNRTGFAWGKYGAKNKILRFKDKPIWVLEKKVKRGFLYRLFGGK